MGWGDPRVIHIVGTPQAMTDINGTVVWTMSQTPFGLATVNEDPDGDGIRVTNNFRFPGQYFDAETGLNYNYQRTYDPAIGRYTQHDPIGLNGGMNPYGYVEGNPIIRIDVNGLASFLVGRRLSPPILGKLAGHLYVVSGAQCVGSRKGATIFSFGQNKAGKLGRLIGPQTEGSLSRKTHEQDVAHWKRLTSAQNSKFIVRIPANDSIVKLFGSSMRENFTYSLLGPNSNSASQAVANTSAGKVVNTPQGIYPGVGHWFRIRFDFAL